MKFAPLLFVCLLFFATSCKPKSSTVAPEPPGNIGNKNTAAEAVPRPAGTADEHVQRSRELYDNGDLAGCRAELNQAITIAPDHVEAIYLRGNLSFEEGQHDAAFTDAEKALSLKPDYAFALNLRGRVWAERKQFDKALADYQAAIVADPTQADSYFYRALLRHQHLGQLDAALKDYDKAISLDPNWSQAHNNRAYLLQEMGKTDAALDGYDKAIALKPHPYFYNNRGSAKLVKGDLEGALADINYSLSLDSKNAQAYCNLALVNLNQGKTEDARQSFEKCYALDASLKPRYEKLAKGTRRTTS